MLSNKEKAKQIKDLSVMKPVKELLKMFNMSKSLYYYHLKHMNDDKYAREKMLIEFLFYKHFERLGYRSLKYYLLRDYNVVLSYKVIRRLMKEIGIVCMVRARKDHNYRVKINKHIPNILNRNFNSDAPNKKWVTDVTEFSVCGKHLYLSVIRDLYNGEIVAHSLSRHNNKDLVFSNLNKALNNQADFSNLILHSDRGAIYQSSDYREYLSKLNISQSMSYPHQCLDNAPVESFFGTLKSETIYLKKIHSINELIAVIDEYIHWYNYERKQFRLNGYTPYQYRIRNQA